MQGAREYARLFDTKQHGRLYFVSGHHARGLTFEIFVLPADVEAISNGDNNAPLNSDAVKVYGILGGNPGWTEHYGWIKKGPWQEDFFKIVEKRRLEIEERKNKEAQELNRRNDLEKCREEELLSQYSAKAGMEGE